MSENPTTFHGAFMLFEELKSKVARLTVENDRLRSLLREVAEKKVCNPNLQDRIEEALNVREG